MKEGSHVVMALEIGSSVTNTISNTTSSTQVTSATNDLYGIDVSAYNVITDYNKVKNAGVQFAILKIIRKDLQLDKLFIKHLNGFKSCGIPIVGVYNYSYATTITKAKTDAQKVVGYLKQYGLNTGMSFYDSYIKPYKSSLKCNIEWIARYPSSASMKITDTFNVSKKPDVGTDIEGWQYSSTGIIDGISGKVDLNVFYGNKTSGSVSAPPFVSTEISIEFLGKINTKSGNLNIRSAPNSSSNKVGSYKNSELVQLIAQSSNNWYRTDKGYISGDYVIAATGKISNCSKLNMRKEPVIKGNNIVSNLNVNDEVSILKIADNGWYKVKTKDNLIGYVSNKYITIT